MTPSDSRFPNPDDWERIDQYLAGELNAADADAVTARRWLMAHEAHAHVLEAIQHELDGPAIPSDITDSQVQESWLAMQAKMHAAIPRTQVAEHTDKRSQSHGERTLSERMSARFFRSVRSSLSHTVLAGALVMLIVLGGVFVSGGRTGFTTEHTTTVYTTPAGQQSNIILPDGSKVLLNVASRLEIPVDFATGNRHVRLDGAAHFTVVPEKHAPFTVTAGGTTARVLGTTFTVRHYASDTSVTVAVRNGKVAVGPVVVAANYQVDVAQNGSTLLTAAKSDQFSFASGTLLLDGVRFKDAIPELNRWYNADIRIADSTLAESRIRVSLSAGSVTDLAMVLEFMLNAVAERQGQILTFYSK